MNGLLRRWRALSLLALLFVEGSLVGVAVRADELNVPYVPYVVVDKNKDEFDYDRLQDEILGYLNRRHSEASTTLYDFLRTSHSPAATPPADVRSVSLPSSSYSSSSYSSSSSSASASASSPSTSFYTVGYPASAAAAAAAAATYPAANVVHPAYAANSVHHAASPAYPVYPASIYKAAAKPENQLVTARLKVTTYQPHRYSTPFDGNAPPRPAYAADPPPRSRQPARHSPFGRVKDHGFTPIAVTSTTSTTTTTTHSPIYLTTALNALAIPKFPYASEMKCSLRSSRYVYDGDCVSRKPVVETVCADRCIRYEYKKSKKPYFSDDPKTNSLTANESKKQVVALSCSDGDVKRQKVKLYCKDGTIINNIIRIVQNCLCNEHSEKVHATKRSQQQKGPTATPPSGQVKAKMVYAAAAAAMSQPRLRSRPPKF